MSKANRRVIARDACSWCGHKRHVGGCGTSIRTGAKPETTAPCPCAKPTHPTPVRVGAETEEDA